MRIVSILLVMAMVLAVLAFGGTEPVSFGVVQLLLFSAGIILLWDRNRIRETSTSFPVLVPALLAGIVLFQMVPLPSSTGQGLATISISVPETTARFFLLLSCFAAFYATLSICRNSRGMRFLVYTLLLLGLFEAFYGLVQYLTGWQQIFTYVKQYSLGDATGTYINRNHFAGLLEMVIPFGVALSFYRLSRSSSSSSSAGEKSASLPVILFWPFFSAVLFVALVFSRSRMGIISCLFAVFSMLSLMVGAAVQRKAGLVFAAVFLLVGVGMAFWIGPEPVLGRFESLNREFSAPEGNRAAIWKDTVGLIKQRPLLGSGLGSFPVVYTSVQTTFLSMLVNRAHDDYLEFAADIGLPGTLLFFGSVLYLLFISARAFITSRDRFNRAAALGCIGSIVAILLHSLTDFNLQIPANAIVFTVILGLAYSVHVRAQLKGSLAL